VVQQPIEDDSGDDRITARKIEPHSL
jgi:hypothetical protein